MVTNKASVLNAAELGRPEGAVQGAENGHGGLGSSGTPAWWGMGARRAERGPSSWRTGWMVGLQGIGSPRRLEEERCAVSAWGLWGLGVPSGVAHVSIFHQVSQRKEVLNVYLETHEPSVPSSETSPPAPSVRMVP